MNDYKIIKAVTSDAGTIRDLHRSAWIEAFSKDVTYPSNSDAQLKWENLIRDGASTVHLASSGESKFGYIAHINRKDILEITDLFVLPEHRGNGIGKTLILAVLNSSNSPTQLWVAETNISAIHLYKSLGFSMTARNKEESRHADKANLIEMYRKGGV